MKIISFIFVISIGWASVYGAAAEPFGSMTSESAIYIGYVQTAKQAATSFAKDSPIVSDAYHFFSGQNIQNARDEDYVRGFIEGVYSIEVLYALYRALEEFFVPAAGRFAPEDLNGGFTECNYNFLKAVFEVGGGAF